MIFSRLIRHLLTAAFVLSLPMLAHAGGNPIVVGQAIDLSGPDGSLGRDYVAGIKTCFDMVNAAGGVHGQRIELLVRDDRGQPEVAARAAAELIERDRVDYLFGGVGEQTLAAVVDSKAFRHSQHVLFAPLANGRGGEEKRVLYWRPDYRQELAHIFTHFHSLGITRVGVAYQDTGSYGDAYRHMTHELQKRGMVLADAVRLREGTDDHAKDAAQLAQSRPGFVLVLADSITSALFLKSYRRVGGQAFVAGTSLTNLATLRELAGKQAVRWNVFSQVVPDPAGGSYRLQLEHLAMMKKYRDEAISALTLEGFAAAKTLVMLLQRSPTGSRNTLQQAAGRGAMLDIGGLTLSRNAANRLSGYLDIALFSAAGSLVY